MSIRAVIVDFGGVLVLTQDTSGRQRWEHRLGLGEGELAEAVFNTPISLQASLGKLPEQAIWQHLAERFNLNPAQVDELEHDFWSGDRLNEQLVEFIKALRPWYRTAILSNAWSGARGIFTQEYRLDRVFDELFISAELGLVKPDPRIYRLVTERLDVRPEECVFLDDFKENVAAAEQAGMKAILFRSTQQAIADMTALLDHVPNAKVG